MRSRVWCALIAIVLVACGFTTSNADVEGSVILTIAGKISKNNRGAFDEFRDGFLKYHDKDFKAAFEVNLAALKRLPQKTVHANAEDWPKAVKLTGPLLADVLTLAGVSDQSIIAFALDGYGAEISQKAQSSKEWILAHSADGRALSIGGRGPLWLVYATGDKKASSDDEAKWVWSVFYIEAK